MSGLNLGLIKETKLKRPPIELQDQFAAIHKKIDDIKSRYQQSLNDLESLYGVLSQQAFKGELDLSRVTPVAQYIAPDIFVNQSQIVSPAVEQLPAINLPETDLLLPALEDRKLVKDLLHKWLEIYCAQLGDAAFSVAGFMNAAQIRITELHPDIDFELGANDYDHIKAWLFEALAHGRLRQARNITGQEESGKPIFGNFIEIKNGVRA